MPRTVDKLQTKNWESMSVRIPREIKEKLREDAKEEMRPIGLHMSYIILQYFKNKKGKNYGI
tara:strand:- start:455 stop:640 length:186 start_codon:yes stop_codon:yes gene_type:complete